MNQLIQFFRARPLILALASVVGINASAKAAPLTLSQYLDEVTQQNGAVKAAALNSEAIASRAQEGELMLAPTLYAQAQLTRDARQTVNPLFQGNLTRTQVYSFGVSKATRFGLSGKLGYNVVQTTIEGVSPGFFPGGRVSLWNFQPQLEFNQSFWRNGFGSEVRAGLAAQESAARAQSYVEKFKYKVKQVEAEGTYWRLAIARRLVEAAQQVVSRAKELNDWTGRRARLQLGDKSDSLQSEAGLKLRQLDLKSAEDELKAAQHAFNSLRSQSPETGVGELESLALNDLLALEAPERLEVREDVAAAQEQEKALQGSVQLSMEKTRPTVDLFGNVSLNGLNNSSSESFKTASGFDHTLWTVGVKFAAPLDPFLASDVRSGRRLELQAAEMATARALVDQNQEWTDLNRKFVEAKQRLKLFSDLEQAQKSKLTYERDRLSRGRSTTAQVLSFEQDYTQTLMARIRSEAELLRLRAQLKLFGGGRS